MYEDPVNTQTGESRALSSLLQRAGLSGVSPAVLKGVAVLAIAALLVAGWRLGATMGRDGVGDVVFEAAGQAEAPGQGSGAEPGADNDALAGEGVASTLWVHVAGAVGKAGLYEVAAGARVGEAIDAAGGALADAALDAVNLARLLSDGEQVYVPTCAEVDAGTVPAAAPGFDGGPAAAPAESGSAVDINTAGEAELVALPGVGPATAAKIVADREANGPFATPEDIMRVAGIAENKFEAMRDLIVAR